MIIRPQKICDNCEKIVATKSIFWHTTKDYVTVRTDDVPGYCNYEAHTSRSELHYCRSCWNKIVNNITTEEVQGREVC